MYTIKYGLLEIPCIFFGACQWLTESANSLGHARSCCHPPIRKNVHFIKVVASVAYEKHEICKHFQGSLQITRCCNSKWSSTAQPFATLTTKDSFNLSLIHIHHILNSTNFFCLMRQGCYIVPGYMFQTELATTGH